MHWLSATLGGFLLPVLLAQGCAGSADAGVAGGGECRTPDCLPEDASADASPDAIVADSAAVPDAPVEEGPRCGDGDGCDPDNAFACAAFEPDAGAGGDVGVGATWGCGVVRLTSTTVGARCSPVGTATAGGPCNSSADCAAGLACIAFSDTQGFCHRYCCAGDCSSEQGTFCAERPLLIAGSSPEAVPLNVPVCVEAEQCRQLLAGVCEGGSGCECPVDMACMVVGKNGLTGCLRPGGGDAAGEPCPCAAGFVCSSASQTCLEVCSLSDPSACDGSPVCQANPALPDGFGTCTVGSLEAAY